jgi:hypothetical protein
MRSEVECRVMEVAEKAGVGPLSSREIVLMTQAYLADREEYVCANCAHPRRDHPTPYICVFCSCGAYEDGTYATPRDPVQDGIERAEDSADAQAKEFRMGENT